MYVCACVHTCMHTYRGSLHGENNELYKGRWKKTCLKGRKLTNLLRARGH